MKSCLPGTKMKPSLFLCGINPLFFTLCCCVSFDIDTIADDGYSGRRVDGKDVTLLRLENENGLQVALTNYGARVVSLVVPDRDGKPVDVVLGHDSLEEHLKSGDAFFGATVGRYANRIKNGQFIICTFQVYAASFSSLCRTLIIFFGVNDKFRAALNSFANMP